MYRAMFDNKRFAILSCATVSMVIILKFVLASYFNLTGSVLASVIIYSVAAVLLFLSVRHRYFLGMPKVGSISREQKITVIKYALQYMVTNGIWALFMLNDIFLLSRLTGDPILVANYKVAYVLPGNLSLVSTSIGIFVAPYFVRHENDFAWVRKAYKKLIKGLHPDMNGGDRSQEEQLQLVVWAWEQIKTSRHFKT
jgi:O-antigen/teichoic acid export membrane protein